MKKIVRRTLEAILIPLAFALPAKAQNTISGNLQSVPSMTPAYSGITFTEINNLTKKYTETDSTTGNFTLNMPSGTYEITIKTKNHRRYIDTITVNGDLSLDTLQMIQSIKATSTYYTDNLDVMNHLKQARGPPPFAPQLYRWRDENQPIRIFLENMHDAQDTTTTKSEFNFAINDVYIKSNGTIKFREEKTDSAVGVKFVWVPQDSSILDGGLAGTIVDERFDDLTPKHITVYVAKDRDVSRGTYCREIGRILRLYDTSPDQNFVMYKLGAAQEFHPDEGHAIELLYKLKLNTDTRKYKDSIDTTITGVKDLTNKLHPDNFKLEQNYPNPFNAETIIQYKLKDAAKVSLKIYDIQGKLIRELVDERQGPGTYQRAVEMRNKATGTYLYEMIIKDKSGIKKSTGKMLYIQ